MFGRPTYQKTMYEIEEITILGREKLELALRHLYEPKSERVPMELKELTELQWTLLNQILDDLMDEIQESTVH
tara:strand:+ start:210 stop:428 length:219 start_codon:yes stop_codon:yes gene_type:complete